MTKSILTGIGVLAMFAAIMAGIGGAFELTAPLTVALLFVWFLFVIFFARFGGFKPFFATSGTTTLERTDDAVIEDSSVRRLISVGAEADEAQSLFGEREPVSTDGAQARTPRFDEDSSADNDSPSRTNSLFGDVLSDRLESDRVDADGNEVSELDSTGITWADDEAKTDQFEVTEQSDESDASSGTGMVVDDDPDWVASTDGEDLAGESDLSDELVEVVEVEDVEIAEVEDVEIAEDVEVVEVVEDVEIVESDALDPDETMVTETVVEEELEVEDAVLEIEIVETETVEDADNVDLEDIDAEKLAAAFDSIAPADPSDPPTQVDYVSEPVVTASTGLSVDTGTELPVVVQTPAPLELQKYTSTEIMAVVKTQEGHLVDTLIDEGVLSTQGPLTDKDIRTMVFVAVSSTELIEVLTEGQRDAVALNGGGSHALESGA